MRLTIPNLLTVFRVVAAPLVAFAFLIWDRPWADQVAFILFALAALTDFFDGWLARRWNQVSPFGRMMDPIADKAMVMVAGAVLVAIHGLAASVLIPITVILLRETLVSGLREFLKGARVLDVTLMAKWKTTTQLVAFGTLFLAGGVDVGYDVIAPLGVGLLWIAAALTAITGWDYFVKGLAYIRAEEERR